METKDERKTREAKEQKQTGEDFPQTDGFWDIENLLPATRRTARDGSRLSASFTARGSFSPPSRRTAEKAEKTENGKKNAAFSVIRAADNPLRASPSGELLAEYTPTGGLLRSVKIRSWPSKYSFYEKFLAAAREIYPARGEKCEFVPFFSFMPQYQQMNHAQLRFYLFWRDNLREGRAIPCDYCYLLLFIYEVLNLPDLLPPEKGAKQLAFLWAAYRDKFPRLDKYLGEWLPDYCLIHAVPCPRETLAPFLTKIFASTTLREFYIGEEGLTPSPDGGEDAAGGEGSPFASTGFVARFLTYASSYDYRSSKYFTEDKVGLLSKYIPDAMRYFITELNQRDSRFGGFLGESRQTAVRDSYTGAVCAYQWKRQIEVTYLPIAGGSKQLSPVITDAVKYCENCIRAAAGVRQRFRVTHLTEEMKALLDRYFQKNLPDYTRSGKRPSVEPPPVYDAAYEPLSEDFSAAQAAKIELASRKAVEILSLGEEDEQPGQTTADSVGGAPTGSLRGGADSPPAESGETANVGTNVGTNVPSQEGQAAREENAALFASQCASDEGEKLRAALEMLLAGDGGGFRALAKARGLFQENLAEAVNDAALARIGDIVCEIEDGECRLLEDYREEVGQWLREI